MKGFRSRAREAAFQYLYRQDVAKAPDLDLDIHFEHFDVPMESRGFATELSSGTRGDLVQIDSQISPLLENWKIDRLSPVDRNLLRLGFFELTNLSTDTAIIINELVELAKCYSSAEAPAFINGVLDRFARQIRPNELAPNLSA